MSLDVRCEDGSLLGDAFREALQDGHGMVKSDSGLHQQHSTGEVGVFLQPSAPRLLPIARLDPRLSVSTNVRAWGLLDE